MQVEFAGMVVMVSFQLELRILLVSIYHNTCANLLGVGTCAEVRAEWVAALAASLPGLFKCLCTQHRVTEVLGNLEEIKHQQVHTKVAEDASTFCQQPSSRVWMALMAKWESVCMTRGCAGLASQRVA